MAIFLDKSRHFRQMVDVASGGAFMMDQFGRRTIDHAITPIQEAVAVVHVIIGNGKVVLVEASRLLEQRLGVNMQAAVTAE